MILVSLLAVVVGIFFAWFTHDLQLKGKTDFTTFAIHMLSTWGTSVLFLGYDYPLNNTESVQFTRGLVQQLSALVASPEVKDVAYENVETDIYGPHHQGNKHFIRIFRPSNHSEAAEENCVRAPVLVYLFPGAWMLGSVNASHEQCAKFAQRHNFLVMCADYRQAPEHVFPTAYLDARASIRWAYQHAAEYGGDVENFFVLGESAGANLAAAFVAQNSDSAFVTAAERVYITALALVYGPYAPRLNTSSCKRAKCGILTLRTIRWGWQMYSANQVHKFTQLNYTFAPLHTPDALLRLFPPTVFSAGHYDPLFDESAHFAGKLKEAGVRVREIYYETAGHMYFGRRVFPYGDASLDAVAAALLSFKRR